MLTETARTEYLLADLRRVLARCEADFVRDMKARIAAASSSSNVQEEATRVASDPAKT